MKTLTIVITVLTLFVPWTSGQGPDGAALEVKGYVAAVHPVQLSPAIGGPVIWLDPNFREGALYKKGQRLAVIDPRLQEARVQSAGRPCRWPRLICRKWRPAPPCSKSRPRRAC